MARNEEKAQTMLNRFITMKANKNKEPPQRRPHLASECNDLSECEKWRGQVIKEISKHVSMIQNGALGEHKIRDLNDTINKFLREKLHWERQIKVLGGADYGNSGNRMNMRVTDIDGRAALQVHGYFYFGAARELPGVRELFDSTTVADLKNKKNKMELVKAVGPEYYGYMDDDDGVLMREEAAAEMKLRQHAEHEFAQRPQPTSDTTIGQIYVESSSSSTTTTATDESMASNLLLGGDMSMRSHVELPSNEEIMKLIVEKKKRDIAAKYGVV